MGRCVTSGVRGLGFRGDNPFVLVPRVWFFRFVHICFGGWLVAAGVVAMCCGAVGVRRVHERLALGGWHCSGLSLVLSTGRCDHCWEGVMWGGFSG